MCEQQHFDFVDLNLDFLDITPPAPTQGAPSITKCLVLPSLKTELKPIIDNNEQSTGCPKNKKLHDLAKRIASTDMCVQQIHALQEERSTLQKQLQELQNSANDVRRLYNEESQERKRLKCLSDRLTSKFDTLQKDLTNKTMSYEQLESQLENIKRVPMEYNELVVSFLRLCSSYDEEVKPLHKPQLDLVEKLRKYCKENSVKTPEMTRRSPKKRTRKPPKPEAGIQCELWKMPPIPTAASVPQVLKETRTRISPKSEAGIQCELWKMAPIPTEESVPQVPKEMRSQGTQHISTTTTRSTCTSTFIKKHNVATSFPEVSQMPPFNDILSEILKWNIRPLSPIRDIVPAVSPEKEKPKKTTGTCTKLCNIQRYIDYVCAGPNLPSSIKCSNSRPPSRNMFDGFKHELSTPPPQSPPLSSYTANNFPQMNTMNSSLCPTTFEELWQVFGQMLFGLLGNRTDSWTSTPRSSNAQSEQEFYHWLRSLYADISGPQQQEQQLIVENLHLTNTATSPIRPNCPISGDICKIVIPSQVSSDMQTDYQQSSLSTEALEVPKELVKDNKILDTQNTVDEILKLFPKTASTPENRKILNKMLNPKRKRKQTLKKSVEKSKPSKDQHKINKEVESSIKPLNTRESYDCSTSNEAFKDGDIKYRPKDVPIDDGKNTAGVPNQEEMPLSQINCHTADLKNDLNETSISSTYSNMQSSLETGEWTNNSNSTNCFDDETMRYVEDNLRDLNRASNFASSEEITKNLESSWKSNDDAKGILYALQKSDKLKEESKKEDCEKSSFDSNVHDHSLHNQELNVPKHSKKDFEEDKNRQVQDFLERPSTIQSAKCETQNHGRNFVSENRAISDDLCEDVEEICGQKFAEDMKVAKEEIVVPPTFTSDNENEDGDRYFENNKTSASSTKGENADKMTNCYIESSLKKSYISTSSKEVDKEGDKNVNKIDKYKADNELFVENAVDFLAQLPSFGMPKNLTETQFYNKPPKSSGNDNITNKENRMHENNILPQCTIPLTTVTQDNENDKSETSKGTDSLMNILFGELSDTDSENDNDENTKFIAKMNECEAKNFEYNFCPVFQADLFNNDKNDKEVIENQYNENSTVNEEVTESDEILKEQDTNEAFKTSMEKLPIFELTATQQPATTIVEDSQAKNISPAQHLENKHTENIFDENFLVTEENPDYSVEENLIIDENCGDSSAEDHEHNIAICERTRSRNQALVSIIIHNEPSYEKGIKIEVDKNHKDPTPPRSLCATNQETSAIQEIYLNKFDSETTSVSSSTTNGTHENDDDQFNNYLSNILKHVAPPSFSPISNISSSISSNSPLKTPVPQTEPKKRGRKRKISTSPTSAPTAAIACKRSERLRFKRRAETATEDTIIESLPSKTTIDVNNYTTKKVAENHEKRNETLDTRENPINNDETLSVNMNLGFFTERCTVTCEPSETTQQAKSFINAHCNESIDFPNNFICPADQHRKFLQRELNIKSCAEIPPMSKEETPASVVDLNCDICISHDNLTSLSSPASPVPDSCETLDYHYVPTDIPLEPDPMRFRSQKQSLLQRLISNHSSNLHRLVVENDDKKCENKIQVQLCSRIKTYLTNTDDTNAEVIADELVQDLLGITSNVKHITAAIVTELQQVPRPEIELDCSLADVPAKYLGKQHRRISFVLRRLQGPHTDFIINLIAQIESTLFKYTKNDLSLEATLNLTQLYLLTLSICMPDMKKNPARLFIAKTLYYYNLKAVPMIYEVLCCFPTTLPHREERRYDRSDPLITVIQHLLMSKKYDMDQSDLRPKELLSKLRFEYHYEPFKPDRFEVLANLVEKIRADKLENVSYALTLFCKRLNQSVVETEVLESKLLPMANEFYAIVTHSDSHDALIACLLECISMVIKPFRVDTNIAVYMSLFSRFLNVVTRSTPQEAAVRAIIRCQRFGYVACYNELLNFKPNYELQPITRAMLETFVYRKSSQFWRSIRAAAV